MLSHRKEHFRFNFGSPLSAMLRLLKVCDRNKTNVTKTSFGNVEVLDISPSGLKIQTAFDIPISEMILLEFTFTIYEHSFTVIGRIMWRNKMVNNFHYGIKLEVTPDLKQQIIDELKKFSKKARQH